MEEVTEGKIVIFINLETQKMLREITAQINDLFIHKQLILKTLIQQTRVEDLEMQFGLTEDFTRLEAVGPIVKSEKDTS